MHRCREFSWQSWLGSLFLALLLLLINVPVFRQIDLWVCGESKWSYRSVLDGLRNGEALTGLLAAILNTHTASGEAPSSDRRLVNFLCVAVVLLEAVPLIYFFYFRSH